MKSKPRPPQSLTVIPLGSTVTIHGSLEGTVTGITLRQGSVQYEVATLKGDDYTTQWVWPMQLTCKAMKQKIGFLAN